MRRYVPIELRIANEIKNYDVKQEQRCTPNRFVYVLPPNTRHQRIPRPMSRKKSGLGRDWPDSSHRMDQRWWKAPRFKAPERRVSTLHGMGIQRQLLFVEEQALDEESMLQESEQIGSPLSDSITDDDAPYYVSREREPRSFWLSSSFPSAVERSSTPSLLEESEALTDHLLLTSSSQLSVDTHHFDKSLRGSASYLPDCGSSAPVIEGGDINEAAARDTEDEETETKMDARNADVEDHHTFPTSDLSQLWLPQLETEYQRSSGGESDSPHRSPHHKAPVSQQMEETKEMLLNERDQPIGRLKVLRRALRCRQTQVFGGAAKDRIEHDYLRCFRVEQVFENFEQFFSTGSLPPFRRPWEQMGEAWTSEKDLEFAEKRRMQITEYLSRTHQREE